ncbi:uncharacterized protein [Lolium perenne]|uniref:uncharacterized protein n=1 Tax=Lolium perenne TaxID=4522 RepID=UPI003A991A05
MARAGHPCLAAAAKAQDLHPGRFPLCRRIPDSPNCRFLLTLATGLPAGVGDDGAWFASSLGIAMIQQPFQLFLACGIKRVEGRRRASSETLVVRCSAGVFLGVARRQPGRGFARHLHAPHLKMSFTPNPKPHSRRRPSGAPHPAGKPWTRPALKPQRRRDSSAGHQGLHASFDEDVDSWTVLMTNAPC